MSAADRDGDMPHDDLIAAGELAFGLLDGEERAAAQVRVATDADFARAYDWWRERSLMLFDGVEAAPPAHAWEAIRRRLPANDVAPPRAASVRGWQAATALAASIALVLGGVLALRPTPRPVVVVQAAPPPPRVGRTFVAVLASADRNALVAVDYDPVLHRLSAMPATLDTGAKSPQLWVIPEGGKPVSLGMLANSGRTSRALLPATTANIAPGATLAISLEPAGGSPTGQPTGAVILTGRIARS